jgi:cytoskeletal protein CcmA (bactofilin family)
MAWKWFRGKQRDTALWTGFLEQGVRLEGRLEVSGVFRIDGQVSGTVVSDHTLILGENARVEGQIDGEQITIFGRFDGVIHAKGRVEIHPRAIVTGEVFTSCLVLEQGGIFDGTCHMAALAPATRSITIPIRSGTQG